MSTPVDFSRFPSYPIHPDRELYRIHRATHTPLWYATARALGEGGRFDLPGDTRAGTCYLATSKVGAFLEKFGRVRPLTRTIVEAHRLSVLVPTIPLALADLTDRTTLGGFGITGDLSTGLNYAPSQRLAQELWAAGFDGIYYAARHDPSFTERSVALFGPAGRTEGGKRFEIATGTIPDDLIEQVAAEFRLHVLPAVPLHDSDT